MLAATTGWVVPASAQTSETDDRRVVVEPFANVSGADDDAWIGDGIADAVAADLGGRVGLVGDAPAWRVRGAYQRIGDRMRITAELVNGGSGATLDALKVDGAVSDLFALQDRLAARLADMLRRHASAGGDTAEPD